MALRSEAGLAKEVFESKYPSWVIICWSRGAMGTAALLPTADELDFARER